MHKSIICSSGYRLFHWKYYSIYILFTHGACDTLMNVVSLHWRSKEVVVEPDNRGRPDIYGGNYPPLWHYQCNPQIPTILWQYFDNINVTHNTLTISIPTIFWHYQHPQYFDNINITRNTHNTLTISIHPQYQLKHRVNKNWDWDISQFQAFKCTHTI